MVKTIKNFLPKKEFKPLKDYLFSRWCNWFYRENMTWTDDPYFYHIFYDQHEPQSSSYTLVKPFIERLNIQALMQIRANLILSKDKPFYSNKHRDVDDLDSKTAIFYMNTCNGKTVVENEEVESVENKLIIFPSQKLHYMISQTDVKRRIVININYF